MTKFRPCIDLHQGQVKQIVGITLKQDGQVPDTNFVADQDAAYFASLYRKDRLEGGHLIMLGPGNQKAAEKALSTWPHGLQVGGGIDIQNAHQWLEAGAAKVIVTSWLFRGKELDMERIKLISNAVGRQKLVFDLSCRRVEDGWRVAKDRWQTITHTHVDQNSLGRLADFCSEYLIHGAEVEGRCLGIDEELVSLLGSHSPIPCTYAGGAREIGDLKRVQELSDGRVDLTFGSALDIFGGNRVQYKDCVAWNHVEY